MLAEPPTGGSLGAGFISGPAIDLTHPFDDRTVYWPTERGFQLIRGPEGVTEKGYFYSANRFAAAEHGGTHVDALYHFFVGGQKVEQIPIERLVGPAVVIDLTAPCKTVRLA